MTLNLPIHHPPRPSQTATVTAANTALYAKANSPGTALLIANDVNVFEGAASTTTWAPVVCSGTGQILLNAGVDTGNVWAIGTVDFPPSATLVVHGSLRTTGGADEVAGQVSGTVFDPTALDAQLTTITFAFPVITGSSFSINSGTQTISAGSITNIFVNGGTLTINPGSYGDLVVNGGTVTLLPGTYSFTSVSFNPAGTLQSNGVASAIFVYVRNALIFRGACTAITGAPNGYMTENLRWAAFGVDGATIGPRSPPDSNVFRGTVVAMNGPMIVEDSTRTYLGGFFGLTLTVHGLPTIRHAGFSAWETPTG